MTIPDVTPACPHPKANPWRLSALLAALPVALLSLASGCLTPGEEDGSEVEGAVSGALPGDAKIGTREQMLSVLTAITDGFGKDIAAAHGAKIVIEPDWTRRELGLAASLHAGGIWKLRPAAGLATSNLSIDTMQVIACHEIGHFLGGFPFHHAQNNTLSTHKSILSAEGQADYYAAKDCLPRIWKGDKNNASYAARIPKSMRAKCDAAHRTVADRRVCYRILATGTEYAKSLEANVSLTTPVTVEAVETKLGHFGAQLRLDTVVAGALCTVKQPLTIIPGALPSLTRGNPYQPEAEAAAKPHACHTGPGARPRSWFRPDAPPPYDCSSFGLDRCEGKDYVYCTTTGIARMTCDLGCTADADGAYCN